MKPTNLITLRVWGDFACFTRPEMKVERVSQPRRLCGVRYGPAKKLWGYPVFVQPPLVQCAHERRREKRATRSEAGFSHRHEMEFGAGAAPNRVGVPARDELRLRPRLLPPKLGGDFWAWLAEPTDSAQKNPCAKPAVGLADEHRLRKANRT